MQSSTAASLARQLMNLHGLTDWVFQFDRAKRRAGCCKYRDKTISLSYYFIMNNSNEEIQDTILHEIAHALAGPAAKHGPVWKAWCRKIGAKPQRCYDSSIVDMPKGRLKAICPTCQREFHRHRRPKRGRTMFCKRCGLEKGTLQFR